MEDGSTLTEMTTDTHTHPHTHHTHIHTTHTHTHRVTKKEKKRRLYQKSVNIPQATLGICRLRTATLLRLNFLIESCLK